MTTGVRHAPSATAGAYLGIDLGTSSVKALLLHPDGSTLASAQARYAIDRPHTGWAEQDPEAWWAATAEVVSRITALGHPIAAVGLSGQMHGLVLIDGGGRPLRPAIIWSDTRSGPQIEQWRTLVDPVAVEAVCGFPVSTGMAALSLTWVRDAEPAVYRSASAALLPKDYVRMRLTGVVATDPTDAGGSLMYDIRAHRPADELLRRIGVRDDLLPAVLPTLSIGGTVHAAAGEATGLAVGTPVAVGGGDQAMAAIALGLRDPGRAAVAISSGGTVFKRTARPLEPAHGLHVLPDARPDGWLAMGVVLSAGLSLDWLLRDVFGGDASPGQIVDVMARASAVPPGASGLLFSSQLGGTRTPVADQAARGSLVGLGFEHGQAHIARALIEGVCLALARSLDDMRDAGEDLHEIVISGGAARFDLWSRTLSDVTRLPVHVSADIEHSAIGAALGASEALGQTIEYDASRRSIAVVRPDDAVAATYRQLAADLADVERAIGTIMTRHHEARPKPLSDAIE